MTARGKLGRWGLRTFALGYLAVLLLIPFGTIFYRAFEHGLAAAFTSVTTPDRFNWLEGCSQIPPKWLTSDSQLA